MRSLLKVVFFPAFLLFSSACSAEKNIGLKYLYDGEFDEAIEYFEKQSEKDEILSTELLAYLYSGTPFVEKDLEKSDAYFNKAIRLDGPEARVRNAVEQFEGGSYDLAYESFKSLEGLSNPKVFLYLGMHYYGGVGVEKNIGKAEFYFKAVNGSWEDNYIAESFLIIKKFFLDEADATQKIRHLSNYANMGYSTAQSILANVLIKSQSKDVALINSWVDISEYLGNSLVNIDEGFTKKELDKDIMNDSDNVTRKWFFSKADRVDSPYYRAAKWCTENIEEETYQCLKMAVRDHLKCSFNIYSESFSIWYKSNGYKSCRESINKKGEL